MECVVGGAKAKNWRRREVKALDLREGHICIIIACMLYIGSKKSTPFPQKKTLCKKIKMEKQPVKHLIIIIHP